MRKIRLFFILAMALIVSSTTCLAANEAEEIRFDVNWEYAAYSAIHSGAAKFYRAPDGGRNDIVVAINAGHGTKGGESVKTQCHPDGSPKVTSGTTKAGATKATAVSSGMTFQDGTAESEATLSLARKTKDKLLDAGYDVLMIRDSDDVQLDNIARTVLANNNADCHIALHYDSTTSDKGTFFLTVPDVASYKSMEPVKSHWEEHHKLGNDLIRSFKENSQKIYGNGTMPMDLTQTSYSTIPSIDLEVGDGASDHSEERQTRIAECIVRGVDMYFSKKSIEHDKSTNNNDADTNKGTSNKKNIKQDDDQRQKEEAQKNEIRIRKTIDDCIERISSVLMRTPGVVAKNIFEH